MPFLLEHITEVVFSILVLLLLGNGAIVGLAVARRQRRERYFQRIDELRRQYGPVIAAVLSGRLEYSRGVQVLKEFSGLDREYILEQLCLQKKPTPAQVPLMRQLCEDLGLVALWQRHLAGQFDVKTLREAVARPEGLFQRVSRLTFLLRARAAENLGVVRHQPSWPLLLKALDDEHVDVQNAALRSLSSIGEPHSYAGIVQRLHDVILKPATHVSLRSVKSALVSFPILQANALLSSLTHPHRRIRFLATDIIREMVEREAEQHEDFALDPKNFSDELRELFLTKLCFDENPDVRARSAPIIAHLPDPRSAPVLVTLLEDAQWFVRLHTVRALGNLKFQSRAAEIGRRLTDPNWMVREASVRTLLAFGQLGLNQLFNHFLSSKDQYSREQIADEMQRGGIIPALLAQYRDARDGQEKRVIDQLALMGKTSYMVALLTNSSDRELRKKFLLDFGRHTDPQIRVWVTSLAAREGDTELRAMAQGNVGPASR